MELLEAAISSTRDPMPWETAGGKVKGWGKWSKARGKKAKPISANRERYGTLSARSGFLIFQNAPMIHLAFDNALVK